MSRKQCRPPDPRPTTRRCTPGISFSFSSPLREFPLPSTRSLSLSLALSFSLSLFPSTDVDYKFSRPPERQRHESPDPRRDCEIEKRCRRTRRADSRPHHGPTPPPAKSPSQGRSPTGWPVMSLGETQQEFSPLSLSLPFRRLSICRSFLSLPCKRAPFLSVSFPLFLRLFADGSRPSSRLSTLSPVCRVYRVILFFFFLLLLLLLLLLRCSLRSTVFSFVSVSSQWKRDGSLSLSLSLPLCTPFCCSSRGSRASSLFLPVNRSLRCTRADSYIYHALLSSLLLLGRGSLFGPCVGHPSLFYRFIPSLSSSSSSSSSPRPPPSLLLTIAVAAVSRMILSLYSSSSVSHMNRKRASFVNLSFSLSLSLSLSTPFFDSVPKTRRVSLTTVFAPSKICISLSLTLLVPMDLITPSLASTTILEIEFEQDSSQLSHPSNGDRKREGAGGD